MLSFQAFASRPGLSSSAPGEPPFSSRLEDSLTASFQSGQAKAGRAKPTSSPLARNTSTTNNRFMKCFPYDKDVLYAALVHYPRRRPTTPLTLPSPPSEGRG